MTGKVPLLSLAELVSEVDGRMAQNMVQGTFIRERIDAGAADVVRANSQVLRQVRVFLDAVTEPRPATSGELVDALLAHHKQGSLHVLDHGQVCVGCGGWWPCQTVQIIDGQRTAPAEVFDA